MTRTERALARRWRGLALACTLVALAGAVILIWARISTESGRADDLAAEADRRGTAVTTLATDVRRLREQVKAAGGTPVAPDPTKAVSDLPGRAEVPVPIPGPRGSTGPSGPAGRPGADATGAPGKDGANGKNGKDGLDSTVPGPAGADGKDSTVPGPAGPPGPAGRDGTNGKDGADGKDGRNGQTCPDGYSLQVPSWDPDALVCRRDGAPSGPSPDPTTTTPAALAPDRRRT